MARRSCRRSPGSTPFRRPSTISSTTAWGRRSTSSSLRTTCSRAGAVRTFNLAVAIDQSGGRRAGAVMGWYTAALSAGYALGAFAGGAFADRIGIEATLLWLGLTPLAAMLAVWFTPPIPESERAAVAPGLALWRRGLAALLAIARRVWLAFATLLFLT